jgi:hypothetical protein
MSENGEKLIYRDNVRRLSDAMREVRIAKADRNDVIIDLKEADRARLEILAEELKPVIDDIPANDDQFDFAISTGMQPRLWIDATSHVMMGRDRRTYRFVRDTRLGRIVLSETPDIRQVRDRVTNYIAERIVERQRMLDGDLEPLRAVVEREDSRHPAIVQVVDPIDGAAAPKDQWTEVVNGVVWFGIGAVTGAGLILLWLWDRIGQLSGN